jgi:4-diphosphocytidyl-2-C-methyl-D-erythritol kinase
MPKPADRIRGALTLSAPAKVNLFLEVLTRRPDGYHAIETLMVAVSLMDTLEFMPAATLSLACNQPTLSTGPDNLVIRAAVALQRQTGCRLGASIQLTKRIPMAAGLAGGSSDAATTLIGLNRLWNLRLSKSALRRLAAEIGSDVAFFIDGSPAYCTGRGEIIKPLRLPRALHFVLVCPEKGLSTAEVYRNVNLPTQPQSGAAIRQAVRRGDAAMIGKCLFNRLQEPAVRLQPLVREIQEKLASHHALGCLMSGSGSTVFAVCANQRQAAALAVSMRREIHPLARVFVVRSSGMA